MPNGYTFTTSDAFDQDEAVLSTAILVEQDVVWEQEQSQDSYGDRSFCYTSTNEEEEVTLTEGSNDTFNTARDDDDSQYFSVFESTANTTTVNELGDAVVDTKIEAGCDPQMQIALEEQENEAVDQQILLYSVEGSDELFGIQMAEDENGVLQKYRFLLRRNELGQLEAIPETIQILSSDQEDVLLPATEEGKEDGEGDTDYNADLKIFVKDTCEGEAILPDLPRAEENSDELYVNEEGKRVEDVEVGQCFEEEIDIKQGILELERGDDKVELRKQIQKINAQMEGKNVEGEIEQISKHRNNMTSVELTGKLIIPKVLEASSTAVTHSEEQEESENIDIDINETSKSNERHIIEDEAQHYIIENDIFRSANDEEREEEDEEERLVFAEDDDEDEEEEEDEDEESGSEDFNNMVSNAILNNHNTEEDENKDSDSEEYQIVEGLHITGEGETNNSQIEISEGTNTVIDNNKVVLQTRYLTAAPQQRISIERKQTANEGIKKTMGINANQLNKNIHYYLIREPEKENVPNINRHLLQKSPKAHPRSILKSSHMIVQTVRKKTPYEQKLEKRLANSKEVVQARNFQNFIAGTKIIHAPVRQERLPRKQKIKPVERQDEEIVVEEVAVSSNGFINWSEVQKTSELPVVFVNLSDSDDDYNPKKGYTRKKKPKRRRSKREITISDSEDDNSENNAIIEVISSSDSESTKGDSRNSRALTKKSQEEEDADEEGEEGESEKPIQKRGRGRPRKQTHNVNIRNEKPVAEPETPPEKKKRGRPPKKQKNNVQLDKDEGKKEIKCTKCTKTFPSEGSLKTHMQYHSFRENSLKKRQEAVVLKKYECKYCSDTFKNHALLNRHSAIHTANQCPICRKNCENSAALNLHKKAHIKKNLLKNTSLITVSPRKIAPKTPNKNSASSAQTKSRFSCHDCGKIFSTFTLLDAHVKTHRRYACSGCLITFASKPVLHEHQRHCVKRKKVIVKVRQIIRVQEQAAKRPLMKK